MPSGWTEDELEGLGTGEYDFREYKGSAWIDGGGEVLGSFLAAYGKQVSAFANGAGGHLFIGIDDAGSIDGGVPTNLKAGGLRAWLEDVTPGVVDPPLPSFNVHEIRGGGESSHIGSGRAVYVIEIPSSRAAPHQALDHRYYLRIAGKSRPMGHVHIEDVLRRTRHPQIALTKLGPYGEIEYDETDARGPRALVSLRASLCNEGRNMARHVGGELILPRPLVNSISRSRMLSYEGVRLTQRPGELSFFKYQAVPLFPTQETFFQRVWVSVHRGNLALLADGGSVAWKLYADDAPPRTGSMPLSRFRVVRRAMKWVKTRPLGEGS
jgi:hypothetical protein